MEDIKLKSIYFNDDDVIIWYNLKVGDNSKATCTITLAKDTYLNIATDEKLIEYIVNKSIFNN